MKILIGFCSLLLFLAGIECGVAAECAECDAEPCCQAPWTINLIAGYVPGRYIGLDNSYGELGVFLAPSSYNPWLPFADLRAYRLDNGDWAGSTGLGLRWLDDSSCRIWGANAYWDGRETCRSKVFNRLGLGLESLGERFDFRVNGYIPFRRKVNCRTCFFDRFIGDFFWKFRRKEYIFSGVDAEVGVKLWNYCDFSFYGAAGPYYYHSKATRGFGGGFARLEFTWKDYLYLAVRVSGDREFKSQVQGEVMVNLPLYDLFRFDGCDECCCCAPQIQPVRRNNVIFTKRCCHTDWNWNDRLGGVAP